MSLGLWLEKWEVFGADRTALVDGESGERWTYADFYKRSMLRAQWLRDTHEVGPGDRVAWTDSNKLEFFEVLFACARLGAILVPVNWRLAPPEIQWILDNAKPRVTLKGESIAALDMSQPTPSIDCYDAKDSTPVLILYTSGTTGRPKGAMLTHGSITANSVNTTVACDLRADDSTITYTPLFHTGAVNVLSMPLFHRGGKVVLTSAFEADRVLSLIESESISIMFGVPTTFEMMRDAGSFQSTDFSSVRFALCGGAPCPVSLIHEYAEKSVVFRQGYGLTEVGPNCFSLPPEDAIRKAGTVGFPVMHCQARIVDKNGQDVPQGEIGELWLKGPHVCAGYWQNDEATQKTYKNGWWATGDLFTRDADGYFKVVGRKKEMFISGGENVYPAEVEQAIRRHPDVKECIVVGVKDEKWGEVGCAYVAPQDLSSDVLKDHLNGQLARYKIPKHWIAVDTLPLTASGKPDRRKLAEIGKSHNLTTVAFWFIMALTLLWPATQSHSAWAQTLKAAQPLTSNHALKESITAMATDDSLLVTGDRTGECRVWSLEKQSVLAKLTAEQGFSVCGLALSGKTVIALTDNGLLRWFDLSKIPSIQNNMLPEIKAKKSVKTVTAAKGKKQWDTPLATAFALHASAKRLAVGFETGDLKEYDSESGQLLREQKSFFKDRISGLIYDPNSTASQTRIIGIAWSGCARILNKKPGKLMKLSKVELTGLCLRGEDTELVVVSHIGEMFVVNIKKQKVLQTTKNQYGWVHSPVMTEKGLVCGAPNDNVVAMYDKSGARVTEQKFGTTNIKEATVVTLLIATKTKVIAGGMNGTLKLYDLK